MPPVKHDLSVVLGSIIRSLLKPAPKTPHASLASSGMPEALWHCFHFLRPLRLKWLLTPQLLRCDVGSKARFHHTDLNRNLFAWAYKQIGVRFVLEASYLAKCGSSDYKRPYKNKQGYLFWWTFGFQGPEQPKSLQSRWQFQMSHIEVCPSAGFCSFTGWLLLFRWHTPCLWQKCLDWLMITGAPQRKWQNLVSLKGRPLAKSVKESKLNHKGPLHSGQIFQLAVKSYLRLTGCDGRKWYVVTIMETAALLLQSCLHDAKVAINRRKPALRNIKLLVGSEGSDFLISTST